MNLALAWGAFFGDWCTLHSGGQVREGTEGVIERKREGKIGITAAIESLMQSSRSQKTSSNRTEEGGEIEVPDIDRVSIFRRGTTPVKAILKANTSSWGTSPRGRGLGVANVLSDVQKESRGRGEGSDGRGEQFIIGFEAPSKSLHTQGEKNK